MDGFYSFNDEDEVRIDVYRLFFTRSTKIKPECCQFTLNNLTFNKGKSNDNRLSHFGLIEEIMLRSHKK